MQLYFLLAAVLFFIREIKMEEGNYQACVDKYSRKGYQPWQEWSDHYTCHRYRCEIRDGKYFIAAVGCRKPKIPENSLECHEFIEDENVEFPTCCARLRCVIEMNGEKMVTTRGQPGEVFIDKPVKGHQSDQANMGMENNQAPMPHASSGMQGATIQGGAGMQASLGVQGGNNMQSSMNAGRGKRNQQSDPVLIVDDM